MPILIKCDCGKSLRVDEKHRGKKVKCPGCGSAVLVMDAAETAVKSERSKTPPTPRISAVAPTKKSKPAEVAEDEGDDDQDREDEASQRKEKPRKSKKEKPAKRSRMTLAIIGGVVAILFCCTASIGIGVWYFSSARPTSPIADDGKGGAAKKEDAIDDLAFVVDGAAGFASIRVADIWKNQTLQDQLKKSPAKKDLDKGIAELQSSFGMSPQEIERVTVVVRSIESGTFGSNEAAIVLRTSSKIDRQKLLAAIQKNKGLQERKTEDDAASVHVLEGGPEAFALHFASDNIIVSTEKEKDLRDFLKQAKKSPSRSVTVTRGVQFADAGKHQVVIAFDIPGKMLDTVSPEFWKQAPNLRAVNGALAIGSLTNDVALDVTLAFPDEAKAGNAKKDIETLKALASVFMNAKGKAPPTMMKLLDSVTLENRASDVVVTGKLDVDLASLGPILQGIGSNQRVISINNMKFMGLAVHVFHDIHKRLPRPLEAKKNSKGPGLSWRVALLPFLDQQALYDQLNHDEPFDSAHNRQFWNKMPMVYQLPGKPNDGKTYYQIFQGNETIFPPGKAAAPITLVGILDGSSNTIMIVEAAQPVNWMAPNDIPFPPTQGGKQGLLNLVGNHWGNNTFHASMGDATVRTFVREIPEQALRAFITRAGAESVDFKWTK